MAELAETLAERWRAQMSSLGLSANESLLQRLLEAHAEPHRRYHGLGHLQALFTLHDAHHQSLVEPARVWMAIWFHDVIYDTQAADNEAQSAALAERELTAIGLDPDLVARICALIRCTANHLDGGSDTDDDLFLDMDFSILGAPAEIYDRYADDVRTEYGWVPEDLYRQGRGDFLRTAKDRDRMFLTDLFERQYAGQARENMRRELAHLED